MVKFLKRFGGVVIETLLPPLIFIRNISRIEAAQTDMITQNDCMDKFCNNKSVMAA